MDKGDLVNTQSPLRFLTDVKKTCKACHKTFIKN